MKTKLFAVCACLAALALPPAAQAQGVPGGATDGYKKGDEIAGPIGGIIGAAVGGVVGGGVSGVLGVPQRGAEGGSPRRRDHRRGRSDDR
jgi:hypothetical protein